MPSLFDSETEKRAFTRVRTLWTKYVEVFPQIPVRKALGYRTLRNLPIRKRAKEYLLTTEFDFVVSDHAGFPILAVEIDGLGHGFSRNSEYIQLFETNDQYRKLKLDAKIRACELCDLSMVVVSNPEIKPVADPDCPVTVLDAIIGEILTGRKRQESVSSNLSQLGEAKETNSSRESVDSLLLELEIMAEQENPIRRRIREMQSNLPLSFGEQFHPLNDRPGYVGARRWILGGIELSGQLFKEKVLLAYDAYVRIVNCLGCKPFDLANLLAEYGLTRKAIRTVGTSSEVWKRLKAETPWTAGGPQQSRGALWSS